MIMESQQYHELSCHLPKNALGNWLLGMARIGYGRSFEELHLVLKKILNKTAIRTHSQTAYMVLQDWAL